MRITTSAEMRELDAIAEKEYQIDPQILMENAGRASVQVLFDTYPNAGKETEVLVFAGKGNNAGDAFVLARRLLCLERRVRVFLLTSPDGYQGPTLKNFEILKKMNAKILQLENIGVLESFFEGSAGPFTFVDGILGTGLTRDLQGIYHDVIELLNAKKCEQVVALDIPTGVNGDTGQVMGTSLLATLTVSYGFPKLGHFFPPGAARRGELVNVDISLPPRFRKEGAKFLLRRERILGDMFERNRYAHKNSFGHALLIGGSPGRLGAICMAARATHKIGTGLVTVATWKDSLEALVVKLPDETMSVAMNLEEGSRAFYEKILPTYSSVIVGPGLGRREEGKFLLENLLGIYQGPMVIDADALNLIADHKLHDQIAKRRAQTVFTPHPGEMARLIGIEKSKVVYDPISAVQKCVELTQSVVVLKGAATVIGSTDNVFFLNHYPNDGMATAGAGDVLAGMIGGLLGQGLEPFKAAQVGVYLHSLAGEHAANIHGHRSMTASDVIENVGNAFRELKEKHVPSFPEEGRARLL